MSEYDPSLQAAQQETLKAESQSEKPKELQDYRNEAKAGIKKEFKGLNYDQMQEARKEMRQRKALELAEGLKNGDPEAIKRLEALFDIAIVNEME